MVDAIRQERRLWSACRLQALPSSPSTAGDPPEQKPSLWRLWPTQWLRCGLVDFGENIHIGAGTFVNYNLTALDVATITIGRDCMIGPGVQLLTPTHPIDPQPRRDHLEAALPITIGDNVWLGGGVIVCPGVTIGDDSVVGADRLSPATSPRVSSPSAVPPG